MMHDVLQKKYDYIVEKFGKPPERLFVTKQQWRDFEYELTSTCPYNGPRYPVTELYFNGCRIEIGGEDYGSR